MPALPPVSQMVSPTALIQDGVALAPSVPARRERGRRRVRRERVPRERRRLLTGRRARGIALVFLIGCIAGGLGYLRAWPPFATVMSASMSPTIETGDLVVMKRIDGTPRVGDVIAVSVPEAARTRYGYPPEVIHRIVRIAPDGRITTKGDARSKPDPFTIQRASVHAQVVATVPAAGRVLTFLTSTMGLVWLGAGLLLLVVLPVLDRQREVTESGRQGIDEVRADIAALEARIAELTRALEGTGVAGVEPRAEPEDRGQRTDDRLELETGPDWDPVDGGQWTVPEPAWDPEPEQAWEPEAEPTLVLVAEPEPEPEPMLVFAPEVEVAPPAPRRRRSGGLVGRVERWANSPAANRYR